MRLRRVVIENYRSCLHTSVDLNPYLSVLIGPNGSGKTNILQAILFLHKMLQDDRVGQFRSSSAAVSSRLNAEFLQRKNRVKLRASIQGYPDESNNDVMTASTQRWRLSAPDNEYSVNLPLAFADNFGSSWGFSVPNRYVFYRHHSKTFTIPPDVPAWVKRDLSRVAKFCRGIRYYSASQFTNPGSCPASFQIEQDGKHRRPFRLRGHAKILYDMYFAKKAEANNRYGQFIEIVGPRGLGLIGGLDFREVKTSSVDYSVRVGGKVEKRRRHKLLVIPQFKIGSQKLSPNQLSEGSFKTLALLFHLITEDSTLLLIEEPEVCVHHGLLSSILGLIKSYSRHKQIILSTHSDYVLDQVKPDNVFRVMFDKEKGTLARSIKKTMTSKEVSALKAYLAQEGNLGEYWREGGLGDRS
jgi:ABC-type lipoprotein export system ATPase subunit